MRVSVFAASALSVALLAGSGHAQVPASSSAQFAPLPSAGFMPAYEIARTVRRSGFDPLAPPLREGSTYVVRATDFRGILMRIVVDARSGAIRDVTRIVPGPGSYGPQIGMGPYGMDPDDATPPYGMPPYGRPPYGQPADYDPPPPPLDDGEMLGPTRPGVAHRASVTILPPLPRPRPSDLASRKAGEDAKPVAATPATASNGAADKSAQPSEAKSPEAKSLETKSTDKSSDKSSDKPVAKPEVTGSAPAAAAAPSATAKSGKSLAPPPIND